VEVDRFYSERIVATAIAFWFVGFLLIFIATYMAITIGIIFMAIGLLFEVIILILYIIEDYQKRKQKKKVKEEVWL
jgi:Zn-dependent membrane protease YugP